MCFFFFGREILNNSEIRLFILALLLQFFSDEAMMIVYLLLALIHMKNLSLMKKGRSV